MQTEKELLAAAYAAFNRRDIDAVLALMSPQVDWPNGFEGGRVQGHEEVRSYWTRQWSQVNPRVDPVGMSRDADGSVVVEVHQVVKDLTGAVLDDRNVRHVYAIREGLIERMEIRDAA